MRISRAKLYQGELIALKPEFYREGEELVLISLNDLKSWQETFKYQIGGIKDILEAPQVPGQWISYTSWERVYQRMKIMELNLDKIFKKSDEQSILDIHLKIKKKQKKEEKTVENDPYKKRLPCLMGL
jgi:hypothetical protein